MGCHQDEINNLILSERKGLSGKNFWRSPKGTIEGIIRKQTYPDIGGKIQLGISYPIAQTKTHEIALASFFTKYGAI